MRSDSVQFNFISTARLAIDIPKKLHLYLSIVSL